MLGLIGMALRAAAALAASGGAFLATSVPVLTANRDLFGLICAAYLWWAVVPPAVGVVLLAWAARRTRGVARGLTVGASVVMVSLAPLCAYASWIAPYQLRVERTNVPMPALAPLGRPLIVVVLADIQTDRIRAYDRDVIARALAEQPDLILLAGDFFQGTPAEFAAQRDAYAELLRQLHAPLGVFACVGNIDGTDNTLRLLEDAGVQLLRDEVVTLDAGTVRLALGGLDFYSSPSAKTQTADALAATPADVHLLLTHTPDDVRAARPGALDLIVCGHTHGGQVVVPGFGPVLTFAHVPREVAAGGLHDFDGRRVYLSRGVGCERGHAPPVRLFSPPELTVLTLAP